MAGEEEAAALIESFQSSVRAYSPERQFDRS